MIKLDKELYRHAYQLYRQWNEAELMERVKNAGNRPPQQAWQEYIALWEFCLRLASEPGYQQRRKRLQEWDEYYARIHKLEAWRHNRGKTA